MTKRDTFMCTLVFAGLGLMGLAVLSLIGEVVIGAFSVSLWIGLMVSAMFGGLALICVGLVTGLIDAPPFRGNAE